jgi:phosphate starvation-inducible PhoH-like protein
MSKRKEKEYTNSSFKPFVAKTNNQKLCMAAIASNTITLILGPAGVGKTACGIAAASEALYNKDVSGILLSRPAVEACGEKFGFMPGDLSEKYAEYIVPVREMLDDCLGRSHVDAYLRNGVIKAVPLGFMRGRTFSDSFMILDESQNTTPEQMKMFLTRIGDGSTVVVNGDLGQQDTRGMSGLEDAITRLSWIEKCAIVEFDRNDCVRAGIVSDILASDYS